MVVQRFARAVLLLLLVPALARAGEDYDRWYVLRIGDQRAGWMHAAQETSDQTIVSRTTIHLELRRGETIVPIDMAGSFTEKPDATPISMRLQERMGSVPRVTEVVFKPDHMAVTITGAGQPQTTRQPLPEGRWLPPAAAGDFFERRLESGTDTISVRAMDPLSGLDPVLSTYQILDRTNVQALGKTLPAIKAAITTDAMPGVRTVEYLDHRGVTIRGTTDLGRFSMTMIAADKALALSKLDPPELMRSAFVTPDRPITHPRIRRRARYLLRLDGESMPDLPAAGAQRVQRLEDGAVRLSVDLDRAEPVGPVDRDALLRSTAMLDADDPRIRALVARATAGAGDEPARRAEAMRRFVHGYISDKNLDVGFASASEVARTREGDCTEHGCLLAAMLRADGIPARVVSGLIYLDQAGPDRNVFGYHMWTQALIEDGGQSRWVDLDATLPRAVAFDATHIALGTSQLRDGQIANGLVSLAPMLGRLKVSVESVSD